MLCFISWIGYLSSGNGEASEDVAGPGVEEHHLSAHACQHRLLDWCLSNAIVISVILTELMHSQISQHCNLHQCSEAASS